MPDSNFNLVSSFQNEQHDERLYEQALEAAHQYTSHDDLTNIADDCLSDLATSCVQARDFDSSDEEYLGSLNIFQSASDRYIAVLLAMSEAELKDFAKRQGSEIQNRKDKRR